MRSSLALASLIASGVVFFAAGCEKTVYRSYESHYCSSKEDDEPYYECAKGDDLVCITTYQMTFGSQNGATPKTLDIWLCRMACDPTAKDPCLNGEVCCPGMIYGRNYGKTHACVMPSFCASMNGNTPRDGGTRDTIGSSDGAGDAQRDGGAPDGAGDVPINSDAPIDLAPG